MSHFLPSRIPVSRRPPQPDRAARGQGAAEVSARFLVRGHGRRAASHERDPRPRWLEPHWKGPEAAAAIVRAYQLKPGS